MNTSRKAGFTLVELAIVMVIIGLIAGGILVGKDLIKAAENRAFVSQLQSYNAAEKTFELKYNCKAGDCANATAYGLTGNGNGNGMVSGLIDNITTNVVLDYQKSSSTPTNLVSTFYNGHNTTEAKYFWMHLQAAGLVSEFAKFSTSNSLYSDMIPSAKNDGTGIILTAWNGKHYFHSGVIGFYNAFGSTELISYSLNFSPMDADYIFKKLGGTTITLGTSGSNVSGYPTVPNALSSGDRIIPTDITSFGTVFYAPPTNGTGGANADYCIDTSVTPAYFNLQNSKKLCALIIQADF